MKFLKLTSQSKDQGCGQKPRTAGAPNQDLHWLGGMYRLVGQTDASLTVPATRISQYISLKDQLDYCRLVWPFHPSTDSEQG